MRKVWLAAAFLSFGGVANAQGTVTLYGRLDAGVEYMSGVPVGQTANGAATGSSHRFRAESGDWGTSLWGIKGVEDLGGGYKTIFQLENMFNAMNGSSVGGSFFNRWAAVGVSNASLGTLLLGRELFIANNVWDFDPFGQSAWSSASMVRGRNWPTSDNNISYQSPKFAGFDFYGQYSLSNATSWNGNGTTTQGREAGAQITYTNPYFQVRGMYDEIRNAANGGLYGQSTDLVNTANAGGGVFAASREYTAAVNVFLGQFKLQAVYQAIRSSDATNILPGQPTTLDHEWGGITWHPSPAAALIAAVYHVNGNNGSGNATMYTIGGSYNLSKRTLLDLQIATARNSKTANFGLNANNPGKAASTDNPLPGHSQSGVYAGIQHSF